MVKATGGTYGTIEIRFLWSGFYKAKEALTQMGNGEFIRGAFKWYAEELLRGATQYAGAITHIYTGQLAQSHIWEYDSHRMQGHVFINPRIAHAYWYSKVKGGLVSGGVARWPFIYGVYEHNRGYPHNFYQRTMDEWVRPNAIAGLGRITQKVDILWH